MPRELQGHKKKRILFFPFAHQFGSTYPLIEMAKFLKSQGHEVLVGGEGEYMDLAKQQGLETFYFIIDNNFFCEDIPNLDIIIRPVGKRGLYDAVAYNMDPLLPQINREI